MLLRRYHDAASASSLTGDAETVVHGDPGPWNMLWLGGRTTGLVDFDEARPGRRTEDLGYFAWKGLRLVPEGPPPARQRRRLARFAESYGVPVDDELLASIVGAIEWLHAKGLREGCSAEALAEIADERTWVIDQLPALH
jgi:aminoglycoside phosphotransferase (APT) family kinase protein